MPTRLIILMLPLLACAKSTTSTSGGAPSAVASENDQAGQRELGQL